MASSYIKDVERQANNINAYQSESFGQSNTVGKHRDMSNYSNNSQYAPGQLSGSVGGPLKQNSSGLMMQAGNQVNGAVNGGIPIFI